MKLLTYSFILILCLLNPMANFILCWGDGGHLAIEATLKKEKEECCKLPEDIYEIAIASIDQQENMTLCPSDTCWDILILFQSDYATVSASQSESLKYIPRVLSGNLIECSSNDFIDKIPAYDIHEHTPPLIISFLQTVRLLI